MLLKFADSGADAEKIFSTFFGSDRGGGFGMFFDDDFGFGGPSMFRSMGGGGGGPGVSLGGGSRGFGGQQGPKQYQIDLNLTLEELYT